MSCGIKRPSQTQQSVSNVYSSPSNSFSNHSTLTKHSASNSYSSSGSLHTVSSPILKSPVPPVHDFSSTRPSCGTRNPPSYTQASVQSHYSSAQIVRPQPSIARPASRCAPKPSFLPAASSSFTNNSQSYASGSSFSSGAQSFQAAPAPKPTCGGARNNTSDPSCLFNGGNLCELGFPAAPGWCTFEVKNGCQ